MEGRLSMERKDQDHSIDENNNGDDDDRSEVGKNEFENGNGNDEDTPERGIIVWEEVEENVADDGTVTKTWAPRGDPLGRKFTFDYKEHERKFTFDYTDQEQFNKRQSNKSGRIDEEDDVQQDASSNSSSGEEENEKHHRGSSGILSSIGSAWFRLQQQRKISNLKRQKSQKEKESGAEFLRLKQENDEECDEYLEKIQIELKDIDNQIQECQDEIQHHDEKKQQQQQGRKEKHLAQKRQDDKRRRLRRHRHHRHRHHDHRDRRGRDKRRNGHQSRSDNDKVRPHSKHRSHHGKRHHRPRAKDQRMRQKKAERRRKAQSKERKRNDDNARRHDLPKGKPSRRNSGRPPQNISVPNDPSRGQSIPLDYNDNIFSDDISKPPSIATIAKRRPQNQKPLKRIVAQQRRRRSSVHGLQEEQRPNNKRLNEAQYSDINLFKTPEAFKDGPHVEKWTHAEFTLQKCQSKQLGWTAQTIGETDTVHGKPIQRGIEKFKAHPQLFVAMIFPTELSKYPVNQQQYTLVYRDGTVGIKPRSIVRRGGIATFMKHDYQPLPSFRGQDKYGLPKQYRDKYTDKMKYMGKKADCSIRPAFLPGRGTGLLDDPTLKLIGEVDPSDIHQGQIGDCWLLSGIASIAEYDGAVERLFRKTKNFASMPFADGRPNLYTITLYDLRTWKEVDIVVDERIPRRSDGRGIFLGAKPTKDGELWVCYLEKAIAAHCGGYDNINGGQCTHAWSLLTGRKEQFIIQKDKKDSQKRFGIYAKYNPYTKQWSKHENCPANGNLAVWRCPWPRVGGGGMHNLDNDGLFVQMCIWDDSNYLIGAGTKGKSDVFSTNGMIDNHAYSVLDCRYNVAGTGIDMARVRNPWGHGEISRGAFNKGGSGWKQYPQIKAELDYDEMVDSEDDGVFWMTKQEFFKHFEVIYLGATDMSAFVNG